ncbi:MAG TPA: PIN domain-containing protein [Terriglobales bacterium]|nr:PIN domain-containing protein [Terriglobales bacterium]
MSSRIFWDTNLFIYLLEGKDARARQALALHDAMTARGDQLFTSALALAELLVKPQELGLEADVRRLEQAVRASARILGFDQRHCRAFATIRCLRGIHSADAVHLACAAIEGMDLFVTGDARLHGKRVEGIQFIVPLERVPL